MAKVDKKPFAELLGNVVQVDLLGIHQFVARLTDVRPQSVTGLPNPPDKREAAETGKRYTPPLLALEFEDHAPVCLVIEDFRLVAVPRGVAYVTEDLQKVTVRIYDEPSI
jgi:hypothetical protein